MEPVFLSHQSNGDQEGIFIDPISTFLDNPTQNGEILIQIYDYLLSIEVPTKEYIINQFDWEYEIINTLISSFDNFDNGLILNLIFEFSLSNKFINLFNSDLILLIYQKITEINDGHNKIMKVSFIYTILLKYLIATNDENTIIEIVTNSNQIDNIFVQFDVIKLPSSLSSLITHKDFQNYVYNYLISFNFQLFKAFIIHLAD